MSKQQDVNYLALKQALKEALIEYARGILQKTKIHLEHDGYTLCGHYGRGSMVTQNKNIANCGLCNRLSRD